MGLSIDAPYIIILYVIKKNIPINDIFINIWLKKITFLYINNILLVQQIYLIFIRVVHMYNYILFFFIWIYYCVKCLHKIKIFEELEHLKHINLIIILLAFGN